MASQREIVGRWADEVTGSGRLNISSGDGRVYVSEDRIYSYGRHFEMGRLVGQRQDRFFLLNGDRYSNSTSGHQSHVRGAVARTEFPSVIIPFSALQAASVELDSIRTLEVQPDRTDEWFEDAGPAWTFETEGAYTYDDPLPLAWTEKPDAPESRSRTWRLPGSDIHATEWLRGWAWDSATHGAWRDYAPGEHVAWYDSLGSAVEVQGDRFKVKRYRHFLGACLFSAHVIVADPERGHRAFRKGRRVKFLSAFDENEARPLYFLCELPRCTARTVAEALDALAPRIVHAALAQGREVERQGDIFAIPTKLDRATLRKRGAVFHGGRSIDLLDTNHVATEVAVVRGAVYARGCLYHDPGFRARDHARRKMGDGKTWHLIVRNTVPRRRI
jgi:hypothetical protein